MEFSEWWEKKAMPPGHDWSTILEPVAKLAWDASRENQTEYLKHEFCRDVKCTALKTPDGKTTCAAPVFGRQCLETARGFHEWLKENGYRIVKD